MQQHPSEWVGCVSSSGIHKTCLSKEKITVAIACLSKLVSVNLTRLFGKVVLEQNRFAGMFVAIVFLLLACLFVCLLITNRSFCVVVLKQVPDTSVVKGNPK